MVHLDLDNTELGQFIGAFEGWTETVRTPIYLDDILRFGHTHAADQFDQDAAAYAVSTQKINHMYEWGTTGINEAEGTTPLSPTSPSAKLWRHKMTGGQTASKSIEFDFRASRMPVPLPTAAPGEEENTPTRRHIFYWKAPIMEFGIPVEIKPVYGEVLFIPLRGAPMTSDVRAIKRDYVMTNKTVKMVPGEHFSGNFSAYWVAWWAAAGLAMISAQARAAVDGDLAEVTGAAGVRRSRRYSGKAKAKTFSLAVSTGRAEAKAELLRKTKNRAAMSIKDTAREPGNEW